MKVVHVEDEDFKYIEKCLDSNVNVICIANEDGDEVVQLNLKTKSKENDAENIVVKWAKHIQVLSIKGHNEAKSLETKNELLHAIFEYCNAIVVAATSGK